MISLHARPREGFVDPPEAHRQGGLLYRRHQHAARAGRAPCSSTARPGGGPGSARTSAGPGERIRSFDLPDLAACTDVGPLNVLILVRTDPLWRPPPAIAFLHEDAFAKRMPKKGLITKREVRLLSLAQLEIRPSSVVWDIGAGSGSVSIEAALLAYEGRVYAIEVDPEGVAICHDNVKTHGVDNVRVIAGRAPRHSPASRRRTPSSSAAARGAWARSSSWSSAQLKPGGRLVANAITLENVAEAYQSLRRLGVVPEVTLLSVARGEPLASYLRYESLNPIHIFAATRPAAAGEAT